MDKSVSYKVCQLNLNDKIITKDAPLRGANIIKKLSDRFSEDQIEKL